MSRIRAPANKDLVACVIWFAACFFSAPLFAATGDLDTSFGGAGKVISAYGGISMFGPAIKVQADGKIVVAGKHYNGSNDDFVVQRYLSTGALDTGFGIGGTTIFAFSTLDDNAKALAFQTDGKILVAGEGHASTYGQHALLRLNADGSVDTSFGVGGKVTTDFGTTSHAHAVLVQNDGRIVVVGEVYAGETNGSLAIARYLSNGTLDSSFGSGGKFVQKFGSNTNGHAVAILSDGRILIGGYMTNASTDKDEFFLVRYSASGLIDTSFGTNGYSTVAIGLGKNYCHALLVQTDGKIVLTGGALTTNANDFALARFNSNGSLDASFGSNGVVTTEFTSSSTPSSEETASGALQVDGKIVVGGYSNHQFALARYLTTGALDTSFGSGGKVTVRIGTGNDDFIKSLALQADGKIVVVGYSKNTGFYNMALARFNNDSVADYSEIWWNPSESGWGLSIEHQGSIMFIGWYTYDQSGNSTRYFMSNCAVSGNGCSGSIYSITGGAAPTAPWTGHGPVTTVGTGTLTFSDTNTGAFNFVLNGVAGSKSLTRMAFGTAIAPPAVDYTALWWNPDESGWGVFVSHQSPTMFAVLFTYDGSGNPMRYVASNCLLSSLGNGCTGTLYKTSGGSAPTVPWVGPITQTAVGTITFTFADASNGTMSFTIDGQFGSKTISRMIF